MVKAVEKLLGSKNQRDLKALTPVVGRINALEAQMILHEHEINVAREERGDLPINSLWLCGGGTVPAVHRCFDTMSVQDPLLRAAALL